MNKFIKSLVLQEHSYYLYLILYFNTVWQMPLYSSIQLFNGKKCLLGSAKIVHIFNIRIMVPNLKLALL